MADIKQTGPPGAGPVAESILRGQPCSPGSFDEAFQTASAPRDTWRKWTDFLQSQTPGGLQSIQERIRRMRSEDGATFNPFNDLNHRGGPWDLELVPLLLDEGDWKILESGLIQRAGLLELILKDVYGPQDLLQKGLLPAELLFDNPAFLRPCHGVQPAGQRYLTFYSADVYRDPRGNFRILRDCASNPAGLGFALENRIVISRVLPELYQSSYVQRLAPFFQAFQIAAAFRASAGEENPAVVLLSPGPDSPIYFEHALLSRYLGYPLVEAEDLTVRDGKVFLKKLAGLEEVDAIFRQVPDCEIDPFALRKSSTSGVAGLIQASREGNIDLINPVGGAFVDTPALAAVLPGLCRHLSGQELLLDNHPIWWCGEPGGLEHVKNNLTRLSISGALDPRLKPDPAQLLPALEAQPHLYVAQEGLSASSAPSWTPEGIQNRCCLMRNLRPCVVFFAWAFRRRHRLRR